MKLKGHSNFNLKLIKNKDGYFVEKSGGKRLVYQWKKQDVYQKLIVSNTELSYLFDVPKVISHSCPDRTPSLFIIPFYNGRNILDILECGDITLLDDLVNKLFMYLKWEFDNSKLQNESFNTKEKLNDIADKMDDYKLKSICYKLSGLCEQNINIPVGYCHGDFTFSNMIFGNKIILIDWLDSFIESPIQDVCKILQEVRLKWTLLMDNPINRDMTKINIGYDYLRQKITQRVIEDFYEYEDLIRIFYVITLLRIIPYTKKDTRIYRILLKEIERIKI